MTAPRDHVGRYAHGSHERHVDRAHAEAHAHEAPTTHEQAQHVAHAQRLAKSARQRLQMGAPSLARQESNESLRASAKARLCGFPGALYRR